MLQTIEDRTLTLHVSIGSRRTIEPRREHYDILHVERENSASFYRVAKVIPETSTA